MNTVSKKLTRSTAPAFWGALLVVALLVGSLLTPSSARAVDETEDAAGWDFGGGGASDISWNGHDGVIGDGVSFSDAGAVFNGSDTGEITVAHAESYQPEAAGAAGTWQLSVTGVTPSALGSHRTIVGARADDDGWVLYITPQRRFEFWAGQKSGSTKYAMANSGVVAEIGGTYDIVAERTGNEISISVTGTGSGTGKATLAGGYAPVAPGGPLRFGNGGNKGTEFFYAGAIKGASISVSEGDDSTPVDPEPPVTVPEPEYPLSDEVYEAGARDVLERSVGAAAAQVTFELNRDADAGESYTISGNAGAIRIEATTPSALSAGAGWYLKYVVGSAVNLGAPHPQVPQTLPAPAAPISNTAHEGYRFAMNDTNEGYTDPYLDWEGWQKLLDNLALHGINQVFMSIGTDAVFAKLLQEHGYSDEEARAWIPQPAHQPWWVLQNISNEGQEPMTQALLDERADLARRIVERANELGITPVLPGYFGTVPTDFAQRNPGANVVAQGTWSNYQRPGWLDPTGSVFADVAADFYRISSELIGDAGAYKMDPLHEGGRAGDVSVPDAAAGIEKALRAAHPKALWSLLGWQSNPTMKLLDGVEDKSRLLIVDGLSDTVSTLDRESRWPGIPYAFGSIYNFGGNTSMGAVSGVWLDRYFAARDKAGSSLNGVAILPEGFYNNPAAYELMSELPWMSAKPDHTQWFRDYAKGRYGSDAAADAWSILAATAYDMAPIGTHSESHDSLFAAQPSLTATKARACCAKGEIRYDLAAFATALPALIEANEAVKQRDAYEYDLTDVTRQVIANLSHQLLPQIRTAYESQDIETFDELTATWLTMISQLDDVIGTNSEFLLGAYVDRAEAQNGAIGAYDLQNLLTTWGTKKSFSLHDYANREWQGLVGDFYASRWEQYFETLRTSLEKGGSPASIDWYTVDEDWAKGNHGYPSKPSGDIVAEARETVDALAKGSIAIALAADPLTPGSSGTVTVTVQNTSPLGSVARTDVALAAPGIELVPTSETTLTGIAPGERRTVTWTATSPDPATVAAALFTAEATAVSDGEAQKKTATVRVLTGGQPTEPWNTFSTEPSAAFSAAGDEIAILTTGADMSRTTRKYSAVYQDDAMVDGDTIMVHVDAQDGERSRPWARSGIVVANDVTAANSPLVLLSITPTNGCALTWNATTGGSLDTHRYGPEFSGPVWLRLTRDGGGFEGACSSDGKKWTVLGTATPAAIAANTDAGLLASAVNSGGTDRVLAHFSGWSLGEPTFPVSISAGDHGTASASSRTAPAGALVSLSTTPETGYRLEGWQLDPETATVTANETWLLRIADISPALPAGADETLVSSRDESGGGWSVLRAANGELQAQVWTEGSSSPVAVTSGVTAEAGGSYDLTVSLSHGNLRLSVSGDAEGSAESAVPLATVNSGSAPLRIGAGGDSVARDHYRGSLGVVGLTDGRSLLAQWAWTDGSRDTSGSGHDGQASAGVGFDDGKAVFTGGADSLIEVEASLALEPGSWLRMPREAVSAEAAFEGVAYTVTYDANGGSGATTETSHVFGTPSALALSGFTREGFTFAGWSRTAEGQPEFQDGEEVRTLASGEGAVVALFAVWKEQVPGEAPTVALDAKSVRAGESVGVQAQGFEPGEPVRVILHSTPQQLTEVTAGTDGSLSVSVVIPEETTAGAHEIEVRGAQSALSARASLTVFAAPSTGGGGSGGNTGGSDDPLAITGGTLGVVIPLIALLLLSLGTWLSLKRRRAHQES